MQLQSGIISTWRWKQHLKWLRHFKNPQQQKTVWEVSFDSACSRSLWPRLREDPVKVLILITLFTISHCAGEFNHGSWLLRDAVHYLSWQVHSASSKRSFTGHQCHEALRPERSLVTNNPPPSLSLPLSWFRILSVWRASLSSLQKNGRLFPALLTFCMYYT